MEGSEKIIAGLIGASAAAEIVSALGKTGGTEDVPDYGDPENDSERDDEAVNELDSVQISEDRQRDTPSESPPQREYVNDIDAAQEMLDRQGYSYELNYLYIDFTQTLTTGSRNRNDVYLEPLTEQFSKLQRRLSAYGKSIADIRAFADICFPRIESSYCISLPGFERGIEKYSRGELSVECLYNMVIRPEKTEIFSAVIPDELDVILVGDLVFRNNIITFTVKGIDLIDVNVKKFGELKITCAAACAVSRDSRNRPDFGLEARELYNPYLTRNSVLSMCENVYPIEEPKNAVAVFEEWRRYVDFRKYYLGVQSQRGEELDSVRAVKAYSVSRSEYNKNRAEYSAHLLDGHEGFVRKDFVLLDTPVETSAEFYLIRAEISRRLTEINKEPAGKGISRFEKELRRFSRMSVALSPNDPRDPESKGKTNVYLGERAAFVTSDIEPPYDDIEVFYQNKIKERNEFIDLKYKNIIEAVIREYRKNEAAAQEHQNNEPAVRERRKNKKGDDFGKEAEKKLELLCAEKKAELEKQLAPEIEKEKRAYEDAVEQKKKYAISRKKENCTRRHFFIYFKAETDIDKEQSDLIAKMRYLIYDSRAEKKKLERQEKAIYSFYHGYVRNPFLSSYLFAPETLGEAEQEADGIEWFRSGLNDTQKEAVRKAIASNSLFLLQGPPGTGKTEVISEITAQLVIRGKKVFISSETHKAIDNVFERLPKIPEIRPIRLIPAVNSKESVYSPERLVDNLYRGISETLQRKIQRYENFTEMKNNFARKTEELEFMHNKLLKYGKQARDTQAEIVRLERNIQEYDRRTESKRASKRLLEEEKAPYEELLDCIEKRTFYTEENTFLNEIREQLRELIAENSIITDVTPEKLTLICRFDIEAIRSELALIGRSGQALTAEQETARIRSKLQSLRDPFTDEILPDKTEEYERYRTQLIALRNTAENDAIDLSTFTVTKLVPIEKLSDSAFRTGLVTELIELRDKITDCLSARQIEINSMIEALDKKITAADSEITALKRKRAEMFEKIGQLEQDAEYSEHSGIQQALRKAVSDFFSDFEINGEYPADDFSAAIDIIKKHWNELENDPEMLEKEARSKIPLYKAISDYLQNEDILENDRISYTKKLFNNANVFGMTCTSREYFSEAAMPELREYDLGDINIRNVGIDVVIIDEVSKSSFLDLLIPILYGKTVILVGDHRQLPPLYDLKHLKEQDLEGLDPEKIDISLNEHYRELYEKCFFKEMFERVPEQYKIMLDRQYRCHSDIMDVFNHFYGKGLTLGTSNQNDRKQHGLRIKANGRTVIDPDDHICFVNCTEFESRLETESPSMINRQEAEVVCKLLSLINEQYGNMTEDGETKRSTRRDGRKSVGVICTYRDQARQIKNGLKGMRFGNFSEKREEKLIISTVDDFQGDERDIIIVSMVRNPKGSRYSTEFIDRFERINVALSRARCLLIIVGSQDFLSKSSIDLPDINGKKELDKHSFPVYREIIRTIQAKGRLLQAADIIGEAAENE